MITFTCATCGTSVRAPDQCAGKPGKCPKCGTLSTIPAPTEFVQTASLSAANTPMMSTVSEVRGGLASSIRGLGARGWMATFGLMGIVLGFGLGYFAGREHLRQQITSQIEHVGEAMRASSSMVEDDWRSPVRAEGIIQATFVSASEENFAHALTFSLKNGSGKHIKAVLGAIHLYDAFGQHIGGLKVARDEPILAGQVATETGTWPGVDARVVKLLRSGKAQIRFKAHSVIYADGQREDFRSGVGPAPYPVP